MSKAVRTWGVLVVIAGLAPGCSQTNSQPPSTKAANANAPDSAFLLSEKPADAQSVALARKQEGGEEEIAVEGRIGGSAEPFVEGIAAFTIVDAAVPHCSAEEGCPTPWDYCCETDQLKENTALVKVVGADGKPVSKDARKLLGVKELSQVVVHGKAKRDEAGNLTVLADKVFIVKN